MNRSVIQEVSQLLKKHKGVAKMYVVGANDSPFEISAFIEIQDQYMVVESLTEDRVSSTIMYVALEHISLIYFEGLELEE